MLRIALGLSCVFGLLWVCACGTSPGDTPDGDSAFDGDEDIPDGDVDNDAEPWCDRLPPVTDIQTHFPDEEPLRVIALDGRAAFGGLCDNRKPFECYWEWTPDGYPEDADGTYIGGPDEPSGEPVILSDQWTETCEAHLHIFAPGTYKVRVKARDASGVKTGARDDCPRCDEWVQFEVTATPSLLLHAELTWERGHGTDLDLYLTRYRTDGSFGVNRPFRNLLEIPPVDMPPCQTDTDCFDGTFPCGANGFCTNECETDADCKAAEPGWLCDSRDPRNPKCFANPDPYIACETDADCGKGYCVFGEVSYGVTAKFCTRYDRDTMNDTCFNNNRNPRWGACEDEDGTCPSDAHPVMTLDDFDGWGPETIQIKAPRPGRYRVVARLSGDPEETTSPSGGSGPLTPIRATVNLVVNGRAAFSGKGIRQELPGVNTYWKVADIIWDETKPAGKEARVEPICAGWTATACTSSTQCGQWYGERFQCATREWGRYCGTCVSGVGTPDDCEATTTPCVSDVGCEREETAKICDVIKGDYCVCAVRDPSNGEFQQYPYANPFTNNKPGGVLRPESQTAPASIWCDAPNAQALDGIPILSSEEPCSSLYP